MIQESRMEIKEMRMRSDSMIQESRMEMKEIKADIYKVKENVDKVSQQQVVIAGSFAGTIAIYSGFGSVLKVQEFFEKSRDVK
jgi:hypothetical protein